MTSHPIEIALRIPGTWANEELLAQAIPSDCKLTGNSLVLADGSQVELYVRSRDRQFVDVFKASNRLDPTGQESESVRNYHLQVCLVGPGGFGDHRHDVENRHFGPKFRRRAQDGSTLHSVIQSP